MGFLITLVKGLAVLGVLGVLAVAALYFANKHVRATRKAKAQEKAKLRQSAATTQAKPAPAPASSTTTTHLAPSPDKRASNYAFPVTSSTSSALASDSHSARPSSRQSLTPSSSLGGSKAGHRSSHMVQSMVAPLANPLKLGMRKRLASFKTKQAPEIQEHMGALGFEASFNPMFEAGFAKMDHMVFQDPDLESEQITLGKGGKFGTMKKTDKAVQAPVLAGAYAMDSLSNSRSQQIASGMANPEFDAGAGGDEVEVIWLEGELAGKLCWEDIDSGELVYARPTEGTITNPATLDKMMSEDDGQGRARFPPAYEEMRSRFKVVAHTPVPYVDYDGEDDAGDEISEALEEIRQPNSDQAKALQGMLGS